MIRRVHDARWGRGARTCRDRVRPWAQYWFFLRKVVCETCSVSRPSRRSDCVLTIAVATGKSAQAHRVALVPGCYGGLNICSQLQLQEALAAGHLPFTNGIAIKRLASQACQGQPSAVLQAKLSEAQPLYRRREPHPCQRLSNHCSKGCHPARDSTWICRVPGV